MITNVVLCGLRTYIERKQWRLWNTCEDTPSGTREEKKEGETKFGHYTLPAIPEIYDGPVFCPRLPSSLIPTPRARQKEYKHTSSAQRMLQIRLMTSVQISAKKGVYPIIWSTYNLHSSLIELVDHFFRYGVWLVRRVEESSDSAIDAAAEQPLSLQEAGMTYTVEAAQNKKQLLCCVE